MCHIKTDSQTFIAKANDKKIIMRVGSNKKADRSMLLKWSEESRILCAWYTGLYDQENTQMNLPQGPIDRQFSGRYGRNSAFVSYHEVSGII